MNLSVMTGMHAGGGRLRGWLAAAAWLAVALGQPDWLSAQVPDYLAQVPQSSLTATSSTFVASNPAGLACDGSTSTYWRTDTLPPQWLQFDLGQRRFVGAVRLYSGTTSYALNGYEIYVSDDPDPENWGTPVITDSRANAVGWNDIPFDLTYGRYVTLRATSRYGARLYLYEMQVYATPKILVHPLTGSRDFTNTNIVNVANFPKPAGYDRYQFTETEVEPTDNWLVFDTNSPPATATFTVPDPEGNIILYYWFKDEDETLPVLGLAASIIYVRQTTDLTAVARSVTGTRFGPTVPAVFTADMIDDGSSSSVGLFARTISVPEDETQGDAWVTIGTAGVYTATLTVTDMAGNTDSDTATLAVLEGSDPLPANLWEVPQNQMQARATSIWTLYVPSRALHAPDFWQMGRNVTDNLTLPQSIILDLRRDYPSEGFSLYASQTLYRPKAYTVFVTDSFSTNRDDWGQPVASGQLPNATAWHTVRFAPTSGRFLVVQIDQGYTAFRVCLEEIKVYAGRPFVLASPVTGDTHFTNTNEVDVVNFPVLADYDLFQVTDAVEAPAAEDPNWLAYDKDDLPASVTFDAPEPEGEMTLYAWFRDSTDTLPPVGIPTSIAYVRATADVQAVAPEAVTAYAWDATFPAVVRACDLREQVHPQHAPYIGAASSATIGLHALTVSCPQDEKPERGDIVVLSTPGEYTVTFTATDRAGNRDTTAVAVSVRNMVAHVIGKRFTEDWTAPANTRTGPLAHVGRGPYPPYPLKSNWSVAWPQQWLVDHVGGDSWAVRLPVIAGPAGRWEDHQTLYAYIENSAALDVDMRVDFLNSNLSGSHNPGIVARFHPRDPRAAVNDRRGYLLYMESASPTATPNTGPVSLHRILGVTQQLTSLAGVVVGQWMTARLLVEHAGAGRTRLRAKVWLRADPEPENWMLEAYDTTPELQTPGRVGVYGVTSSNRRFSLQNFDAKPLFRGGTLIMLR